MISIPFWTILVLGPIPVVHIFLHLFLRFWWRYPYGWYILCAVVWAIFFPLAKYAAGWPLALFVPPAWLKIICAITGWSSLFLVFWSVGTLGPKRFFLWAVLRPGAARYERILSGPYRFLAHPAYTAYLITALAAFFATGEMALLIFSVIIFLLMAIIVGLENHELKERFGTTKINSHGPFAKA